MICWMEILELYIQYPFCHWEVHFPTLRESEDTFSRLDPSQASLGRLFYIKQYFKKVELLRDTVLQKFSELGSYTTFYYATVVIAILFTCWLSNRFMLPVRGTCPYMGVQIREDWVHYLLYMFSCIDQTVYDLVSETPASKPRCLCYHGRWIRVPLEVVSDLDHQYTLAVQHMPCTYHSIY